MNVASSNWARNGALACLLAVCIPFAQALDTPSAQDRETDKVEALLGELPASAGECAGSTHFAKVAQVVEILRDKGLLSQSDQEVEAWLVKALLESTAVDLGADASLPDKPEEERGAPSRVAGPWRIDARSAYVRVDHVGEGFETEMAQALDGEDCSRAAGLILDLRTAAGTTSLSSVAELADLPAFRSRPCAVLVGRQTSGGAEVLATLLARRSNVVVAGRPTKGMPFPPVVLSLVEGVSVAVPAKPNERAPARTYLIGFMQFPPSSAKRGRAS
jgi:hypothetical protein